MNKKTILIFVKTVLPILLGLYLFWIFFTGMTEADKESFRHALSEANYFWIFLSLGVSLIALFSRAIRWKYMLEPLGYKTPLSHRYHAMMIGYLINFTIPRAGEVSRAAMLYRSDAVPFSKSFGTIIAERAVDLIMLGIVFLITMAIGYEDLMKIFDQIAALNGPEQAANDGISTKMILYIIIGVLFLGGILVTAFHKGFRAKLFGFIKDVLNGVLSVFKTKNPFGFIGHSFLIWICYVLMFAIPFYSMPETSEFPLSGYLIGFIAGAVGITLTNGGLGVYPLLVGMVVTFYIQEQYPENAQGIGKALGMLVWLSQTIFMIVLGLLSLALLPKNYEKENVKNSISGE